jgi:ABC-type sugar transport system ATPase subunit
VSGLRLTGIHRSFGDVAVLRDLDLDVPNGTLLTLLGPSGSGKTTLLRIAAGLDRPDQGRISMDGRDVTDLPPARRNVAMVFQSFALFPHMTVAENIGFGLAARKTPRDVAGERIREAAALAGCQDLLERRPAELSGGEQQRAALARGLARRPGVFLLDEPLSNLDAPVRAGMRAELMRLQRRIEGTMLYVTHDQAEALTMGDLVAVLDRGSVQQVGAPEELYRRPANRLVATFIGTPGMNVLPAVFVEGELRVGPFRLPFPRDFSPEPGAALEVGVRPAAVRIGGSDHGEPATVELVEVAGEDAYVHLRAGEIRLVAAVPSRRRPQPGDRVVVAIHPEELYVFDAHSGRTVAHPR